MIRSQPVETAGAPVPPFLDRTASAGEPLRSCPVPTSERADLPALERVTERAWWTAPALLLIAGVPVALIGLLASRWSAVLGLLREEAGPRLWIAMTLGVGGSVALLGWLLARMVRSDCAWTTDPEGIEARGLFHRRRCRWTEITAAAYGENSGRYHVLASAGRITFVSGKIAASVWQHLRRHDRHHSYRLRAGIDSLWDDYPSVALPLAWTNPARVPAGLIDSLSNEAGSCFLFTGLLLGYLNLDGWGSLETGLALLGLAGAGFGIHRARLRCGRCVRRGELTADGLGGETWLGPFHLRWEEIAQVEWQLVGSKTVVLRIATSSGQPVFLPVERTDPRIAPLLFAILHRLRYANNPQSIVLPGWLRASPGSPPPEDRP